jgi:nucleoside-diphosphate kinase
MMKQQTLVLLKPDAVRRGLTGEILHRFEKAGLKIIGMKMVWIDEDHSKEHYSEHVDKAFYEGLEEMITEGPVVAAVLEGIEAVTVVRKMVGSTEPKEAAPGTIRGDYTHHSYALADAKGMAVRNVVHASGDTDEAADEIALWFDDEELHTYKRADEYDHFGDE